MATPTGPRAQAARGFFSRVRRRKKQDQKDYDIAGLVASPHDFGSAASSAAFPNALTLPANVMILAEVLTAWRHPLRRHGRLGQERGRPGEPHNDPRLLRRRPGSHYHPRRRRLDGDAPGLLLRPEEPADPHRDRDLRMIRFNLS